MYNICAYLYLFLLNVSVKHLIKLLVKNQTFGQNLDHDMSVSNIRQVENQEKNKRKTYGTLEFGIKHKFFILSLMFSKVLL